MTERSSDRCLITQEKELINEWVGKNIWDELENQWMNFSKINCWISKVWNELPNHWVDEWDELSKKNVCESIE